MAKSVKKTIPAASFTIKSNGILRVLSCQIEIFQPHNSVPIRISAIWDTGATSTVITEKVVNSLGLIPTGVVQNHTAGGIVLSNTYLVNISLPNKVLVSGVPVCSVPNLSGNADALIGMDIITLGDYSITNFKGQTCMSFRIPSLHEIDYVINNNIINPSIPKINAIPKIYPNDPCTCGSGKKFKQCHGKLA